MSQAFPFMLIRRSVGRVWVREATTLGSRFTTSCWRGEQRASGLVIEGAWRRQLVDDQPGCGVWHRLARVGSIARRAWSATQRVACDAAVGWVTWGTILMSQSQV